MGLYSPTLGGVLDVYCISFYIGIIFPYSLLRTRKLKVLVLHGQYLAAKVVDI